MANSSLIIVIIRTDHSVSQCSFRGSQWFQLMWTKTIALISVQYSVIKSDLKKLTELVCFRIEHLITHRCSQFFERSDLLCCRDTINCERRLTNQSVVIYPAACPDNSVIKSIVHVSVSILFFKNDFIFKIGAKESLPSVLSRSTCKAGNSTPRKRH